MTILEHNQTTLKDSVSYAAEAEYADESNRARVRLAIAGMNVEKNLGLVFSIQEKYLHP